MENMHQFAHFSSPSVRYRLHFEEKQTFPLFVSTDDLRPNWIIWFCVFIYLPEPFPIQFYSSLLTGKLFDIVAWLYDRNWINGMIHICQTFLQHPKKTRRLVRLWSSLNSLHTHTQQAHELIRLFCRFWGCWDYEKINFYTNYDQITYIRGICTAHWAFSPRAKG